jgi:dienelactone hydrolase
MKTDRRQFLKQSSLIAASAVLAPLCSPVVPGLKAGDAAAAAPNDVRLRPLKDLDGYFPFTPPKSREEWVGRAEALRRRLLVALGLWPMPARTPLNPVIHGAVERENFRVEKVFFESAPGFFVTGSLYRPLNVTGKVPGVLFAHGHWDDGRFMDTGEEAVRQEIARGAEHFEEGGRSIMQALCTGLARMGCAVFHYDMIGYADSRQLSLDLAHRFAKQRPEMISPEPGRWGLFSPQAESHLQSVMGLQIWNSMRSLDFLLGLPEVDAGRIACTGASGGGTQTFILSALDDRVKVAFPAVMVSTAMQGGCTCENACLLRVAGGNVEIAGLIAPRPLGMTCANDWTKEMSTKGFPELKQLYALLGAEGNTALFRGEHFDHNYNSVSRVACYGWLNRHFKLGFKEPVIERDFKRLTRAELSVWDDRHPAPPGGPDFERQLLKNLQDDAKRQLEAAGANGGSFRKLAGPAVEVILGRTHAGIGEVQWRELSREERDWGVKMTGRIINQTHGEELPSVVLEPKNWKGAGVLWLSEAGKSGLFGQNGLIPEAQRLVDGGVLVCGVDLLYQGDFLEGSQPPSQTRRVKNPRESAAYTFGYNQPLFSQRVHDVLTALRFLSAREPGVKRMGAVALDAGSGPILASALAVAGELIESAALNTHGFRFIQVDDLRSPYFLPGGAKYGDLPGMMALNGAKAIWLAGEPESSSEMISRLSAARVTSHKGAEAEIPEAVAKWLLAL